MKTNFLDIEICDVLVVYDEYAVSNYGEYEVKRIWAFNNALVITVI